MAIADRQEETRTPEPAETEPLPTAHHTPAEERAEARFEWMAISLGLTALVAIIALIVAFVAVGQNATHTTVLRQVAAPGTAATISAPPAQSQFIAMRSDSEHGRKGPDGKWHDAALPADFTVKAGARVTVTVDNYDSPHTFTAPGLGVNAILPGGTATNPSVTKFTFTAPKSPGQYMWHCSIPCDPWAMMHMGYMMGTVTVRA